MKFKDFLLNEAGGKTWYIGAHDWSMSEAKFWFFTTKEQFLHVAAGIIDPASEEAEKIRAGKASIAQIQSWIENEGHRGGDNGITVGDDGPRAQSDLDAWVLGEDFGLGSDDDDLVGWKVETFVDAGDVDTGFIFSAEGK